MEGSDELEVAASRKFSLEISARRLLHACRLVRGRSQTGLAKP